jgi:hypothetical protein
MPMNRVSLALGEAFASLALARLAPAERLLQGEHPRDCCTLAEERPCVFPSGQAGSEHELELTFFMPCAGLAAAARLGEQIRAALEQAIAGDAITLPGHLVLEAVVSSQVIHRDCLNDLAFVRLALLARTLVEQ